MWSSSFLAKRFGHARVLGAAEQRYAEGEVTNEEVSVIDAEGWRGTPMSTVAAWLEELPLIAGSNYDGTVAEHFNEYDKRDRALQFAAEHCVSIGHCCAVGDSRSDLPLFVAVPTSLALNAGDAARAAASAAVDTKDLRDVIPWLEALKAALH